MTNASQGIIHLRLQLHLLSDATFGRGDGIAGLVDEEVEHDSATGLPYIRGRMLRGLLVEECANLLYALKQNPSLSDVQAAARRLFGRGGSQFDDGELRVGAATLHPDLRRALQAEIDGKRLAPAEVLESLTTIRRQTAVNNETDAPEEGSLRAMRAVLRGTDFEASLDFMQPLDTDKKEDAAMLALLAACVAALRRGGTGRNRGRGRLIARLLDAKGHDVGSEWLARFGQQIESAPAAPGGGA